MAQFDVHANPLPVARRAYPYVVVLQSDATAGSRDRIVAPLAPRGSLEPVAGRLTPVVRVGATEYVVLVHALSAVRARDLVDMQGSLADARGELLAALDYLFSGV
jgi:toxin CcdB